ncbi:MAG: hypothetical protein GY865_16410 [candidate division Zixibacteria bacterium]|nr:hypothetical protein [candidate division Zixibacteria bacterium]
MKTHSIFWRSTRKFTITVFLFLLCGLVRGQDSPKNGLITSLEPPRALYNIDCSIKFDSAQALVSGTETISFINTSTLPINRLALDWVTDSLHSMDILVNGEAVKILSSPADDDTNDPIIIQLPQVISPEDKIEIYAQFKKIYTFEPGDGRHLFTGWYPRIYWGMRSQDDFNVKINYSSGFAFGSSGLYNSETDTYHANSARKYGLYFLKNAVVTEKKIEDITVRIIHTPAAKECADLVMETAVDAITYYKKRFGFYPSDHIDIIQGVDFPNGGFPAATNLVGIHGMEQLSDAEELHWRWITAHEIGHQYWYEYVMSIEPNQIGWLMIGLGIYVDREYSRYSGLSTDKHTGLMSRYINGIREGLDTRADVQRDYLEDIGFDFNNVVVHGKGYSIISALNCYLGDELFDQIHGRCLIEFAGKQMGFYDFQTVCEQESGQDLNWFFDQWVRTTRYPAYEITSQECNPHNGEFISNILVERTGTLDMPVPVTAYFSNNTKQTKFTNRLQQFSNIQFESKADLDSAVVDAKNEIAMVIPPPGKKELEIRKVLFSMSTRNKIDSIPSFVAQALKLDIEQTLFWGQLGRKLYDWELYEEALAVFKRRAELLEKLESIWTVSVYGWQGLLLDLLGRREEAIFAYNKALEKETDREFSYNGDPVTISHEWLQQRLQTPFMH